MKTQSACIGRASCSLGLCPSKLFRNRTGAIRRVGIVVGLLVAAAFARASTVTPTFSNTGGSVKQVSIANLQQGWVVTAVENSKGNLQVQVWNDNGAGIVKTGSATGEAISKVSVTGLDLTRVVTAVVNPATGYMDLSVWKVTFPAGTIAQQGSTISICCTATGVSITRLDPSHVVTASILVGNLTVNGFKISSKGVFTTEGVASEGAVSQVAITALTSTEAATAIRNSSGKLGVRTWKVSGGLVTAQSSAVAGTANHVGITAIFTNQITTSMVNGSGDLELINWGVGSGGKLTKQVSATAVAASQVAICQQPISQFTAIIDGSKDLAVQLWNSSTSSLSEAATYDSTSSVTLVAVAPDFTSDVGQEGFVTAARGSDSTLEIQVWEVN